MSRLREQYNSLPVQVKASLWFLICSFLQKGISMITTPIFTRLLNTSEYGQFNVFTSWHGIFAIIVGLSLTAGVHTQGLIKFEKNREAFSSSLQGLTSSLIIIWLLIYWLTKDFWNGITHLNTPQMLAMLIMIWATSAFSFWANEQRVKYAYRMLVVVILLVSFIQPIVSILLVIHLDEKVTARILGMALVEIVLYPWLFINQLHRGKTFYSAKFWKYAILFNLPLVPHYLSQTVLVSSDRIMIENMIGASEAGIYGLAYSISMIMILFNAALGQTLSPWIYQKIKDKRTQDIAPVAYSTLALIAAVNVLLILLAPEIVTIFAPKEYHDAVYAIPPIAMSVYFIYCYDLFAKFAFYYEKTAWIMLATLVGAILNIVLNYYGIGRFGYIAAAYTTLICFFVYSLLHYCLMIRVCKEYNDNIIPYNTKRILLFSLAFVMIGFSGLATYNSNIVRYFVIASMTLGIILLRKHIIRFLHSILAIRKRQ